MFNFWQRFKRYIWQWFKKHQFWLILVPLLIIFYAGLSHWLLDWSSNLLKIVPDSFSDFLKQGWFGYSISLASGGEGVKTSPGVVRGLAFLLALPIVFVALILAGQRTIAQSTQAKTDSDRLLAETFAKSIELLGHKKSEVKQGAIYALGKIAETNPAEREVIADTLCAFIRHNRHIPEEYRTGEGKPYNFDKLKDDIDEGSLKGFNRLAIDIEAAIKVIIKMSETLLARDNRNRLYNLSNIYLKETDFSRAKLSSFNLSDSMFDECIFEDAKFGDSNLVGSNFKNSNFKKVKFEKNTELQKADLSKVEGLTQQQINVVKLGYRQELKLPQGL